jgi:hypothetical protein
MYVAGERLNDRGSHLSSLKPVYASPMAGGLTMATLVPAFPCTACTLSPALVTYSWFHAEPHSVVLYDEGFPAGPFFSMFLSFSCLTSYS